MTHQEAIKLREEYLFLIGQVGEGMVNYMITDLLVVPSQNPVKGVRDKIVNPISGGYANDYTVSVVVSDGASYLSEDISVYKDRKKDIS